MTFSLLTRICPAFLGVFVAACATSPGPEQNEAARGSVSLPVSSATISVGEPSDPFAAPINIPAGNFGAVPGWGAIDPRAGLEAFRRSCRLLLARSDDNAFVSDRAAWAGRVGEWRTGCGALSGSLDAQAARLLIESRFIPVEVVDPEGQQRFTGYFEPIIDARRRRQGAFTAAIPGPPGDLIVNGDQRLQRLADGRTRAYPPRSSIRPDPGRVLGYAHPADVFFLQIQGSGRLVFEDGATIRAAYHAHNGHAFVSTANWLLARGEISRGEASMQGIRAWMDRAPPARVAEAINANPRYVFFEAQPVTNPGLGPAGAQGVPLTALGSFAIDPDFHALGLPYVAETTAPGLGGLWRGVLVSQDTGGAIKGPVRGDSFFGTGAAAGDRAGTMNAPGRLWALLPPAVANRLRRPAAPDNPPVSP